MIYKKKSDLKVECIVTQEDFAFLGTTLDDILDRTEAGMCFLKRLKKLCAMTQKIEWTHIAYTLNITVLTDGRVSFEFSEHIEDYIRSLKNSLAVADAETSKPLQEFINTLERTDEENARRLIAYFEKSVKNVSNPTQEGKLV